MYIGPRLPKQKTRAVGKARKQSSVGKTDSDWQYGVRRTPPLRMPRARKPRLGKNPRI